MLSIDSDFVVVTTGHTASRYADQLLGGRQLLDFLEMVVTSAGADPDGTLELMFGAAVLTVLDSNQKYESYQIQRGDDTYVV